MMPLYAARIEDLGQGDFVKVDCAACQHVALLAPEFLLRLGLSPQAKVLDLKERVRWAQTRQRPSRAVNCWAAGPPGRNGVSARSRSPGRRLKRA
jgi:hypothetical protein